MNENTKKYLKQSKSTKVIIIAILSVLLNIPLMMVSSQVDTRKENESQALESVKKSWGDIVDVNTPYIKISDEKYFPDFTESHIDIQVQQKKRGYFNVPVYDAKTMMKMKFNTNKKTKHNISNSNIEKNNKTEQTKLIIPFKNSNSMTYFKISEVGQEIDLAKSIYADEIIVELNQISEKSFFEKEFLLEFHIRGVDQFNLNLFSKTDKINLVSNWKDSKFDGDILPMNTSVTDLGVVANWLIHSTGAAPSNIVSVILLWNNPDYLKLDRILSYGFLFIALIFMTFFILETAYKNKLHPVQYGSVGMAICVFYLLLLALLEKIGFKASYILSSLAIISLNTFYVAGSITKTKGILIFFVVETILHIYFYIILSLENFAFLIGSLGLFVALATFMLMTRKYNWYESAGLKDEKLV